MTNAQKGNTMSGRFMTKRDLESAKRAQEIFNSRINRGEIDPASFSRTHYTVCGCGVEGCGFISKWPAPDANIPKSK